MLIRIYIKNYFSFGEATEFNLLPSPRYTRLSHHKYDFDGVKILKLSAIYGANGAGKSNLIKALSILKNIVCDEELPIDYNSHKFKFHEEDDESTQILGIEFIQNDTAFYYAIETKNKLVVTEELFKSGLGKNNDELIFERRVDGGKNSTIQFSDFFLSEDENVVLKNVIEKNLSKANKPILKLLTTLNNEKLKEVTQAFNWFDDTLHIILPESKAGAMAQRLDTDKIFKKYAEDMICSFNMGICSLMTEKKSLESIFDEKDIDFIKRKFENNESGVLGLVNGLHGSTEINIVKEENEFVAKRLRLEHTGKDGIVKKFHPEEESDGTLRLIDFIPAFKHIADSKKVIIVDEIERSIHPLLIKELVKKFSDDENSNGQFIFTTHESNLLDQAILRQDEIWFVEKDTNGNSDIYSLSDFKEHNTKDIRKGYLNGRYGSIPFLANLKDLNWHDYDIKK